MFNALNRFISRLDGEPPSGGPRQAEQTTSGFQVLRNTTMSLAIEPFFDFIIGINGRAIDNPDPGLFAQEVRNCAGGSVSLGLWSAKGHRPREMHIAVPADTGSLGLTVQWTPLSVAANIWHVLDVPANSPAELAGLLPYGDYIIGSPEGVLHGEGGLGELVEDHIGRPMRLYIYNNEFDVTREVTVHPSRDWGGEGALGCVLGYGALHRLPAALSEPVSVPGEIMFDGDGSGAHVAGEAGAGAGARTEASQHVPTEGDYVPVVTPSEDMLVPADLTAGSPPMGGPTSASSGRSRKKERHNKPNNYMDDYLKEEEQKSLALDRAPSGRATPLPPPPKAGAVGAPPPPPPPPPSKAQPAQVEEAPEEQG